MIDLNSPLELDVVLGHPLVAVLDRGGHGGRRARRRRLHLVGGPHEARGRGAAEPAEEVVQNGHQNLPNRRHFSHSNLLSILHKFAFLCGIWSSAARAQFILKFFICLPSSILLLLLTHLTVAFLLHGWGMKVALICIWSLGLWMR